MSKQKANKEAARKAKEKQQQRKQLIKAMRNFAAATALLLIILAIASARQSDASIFGDTYDELAALPVACDASVPALPDEAPRFEDPTLPAADDAVRAILETSCGPIEITLDRSISPTAVDAFVFLADNGYYNSTASHRLRPDIAITFGDPTATGKGDPGFTFQGEPPADDFVYERGVVAMELNNVARNNGQFFIVLADDLPLAPTFSPIGTITVGHDVLDRLEQIPVVPGQTPEASQPTETIFVTSVVIEK